MCPPTSQPLCVYAWHSLIKRIYSFASSSCRWFLLCVLDFSSCPLFKETTPTTCHRPHPCFVIFFCFCKKHLLASRLFNSPGSPSTLLAAQSQSTLLLTSLYHFTSLCEVLDFWDLWVYFQYSSPDAYWSATLASFLFPEHTRHLFASEPSCMFPFPGMFFTEISAQLCLCLINVSYHH